MDADVDADLEVNLGENCEFLAVITNVGVEKEYR